MSRSSAKVSVPALSMAAVPFTDREPVAGGSRVAVSLRSTRDPERFLAAAVGKLTVAPPTSVVVPVPLSVPPDQLSACEIG
jgi:hypothetical protein